MLMLLQRGPWEMNCSSLVNAQSGTVDEGSVYVKYTTCVHVNPGRNIDAPVFLDFSEETNHFCGRDCVETCHGTVSHGNND
jgi:hypothetical protein